MDGISITHGSPRAHIWSYVVGVTEHFNDRPCANSLERQPQSFVGDNYYCESGNSTNHFSEGHLFPNDRLWDGLQCEGNCCTGSKSPPWFSVQLPGPTNDTLEVRICGDESTGNEDTPVELLKLYVSTY